MAFAWPMCKIPLGSGGNRVTTCLTETLDRTTRCNCISLLVHRFVSDVHGSDPSSSEWRRNLQSWNFHLACGNSRLRQPIRQMTSLDHFPELSKENRWSPAKTHRYQRTIAARSCCWLRFFSCGWFRLFRGTASSLFTYAHPLKIESVW